MALEDDVPGAGSSAGEDCAVDLAADLAESTHEPLAADERRTPRRTPVDGATIDPAPPATPAVIDAPAIETLHTAIAELGSQVAKDHDRAAAREKTIDRLHEEVEKLRAGETRSVLRPAVTDLRRLHGDLITQARSAPETMTRKQLAALLESFADSVELTLERCGIVIIRPACGTSFDPRSHQTVGVTPTDQPNLDGTIMKIISDGYSEIDTGRPLVPARVNIYRITPAGDGTAPPVDEAGNRAQAAVGVSSDTGAAPPFAAKETPSLPRAADPT